MPVSCIPDTMFEGVLKSFELIILMFHARLEPKSYLSAGALVVVAWVSHPLNPHVFGRLPINYDVTRSYVFRLHGHQRAGCSRVKLQRRDQKGHTDSPLQVRVHDARRAKGKGHRTHNVFADGVPQKRHPFSRSSLARLS
jgi:hypothetical protein